jgi:MTH538 TIR-like domain (DUF1863)
MDVCHRTREVILMLRTRPSPARIDASAKDVFPYDAFISYSGSTSAQKSKSSDRVFAEHLHSALESYRAPKSMSQNSSFWPERLRLRRVFLDREELHASSSLGGSLEEALGKSRFLIVVCSPRSRVSPWVDREVAAFLRLRCADHILSLLIEGEPENALPPALFTPSLQESSTQFSVPLAADIRAGNTRESLRLLKREKLRLLAPLLGVSFDDLRQREHQRAFRRRTVTSATLGVVSVAFASLACVAFLQRAKAERNYNTALEAGKMTLPLLALEQPDLIRREVFLTNAITTVRQLCREDSTNTNCLQLLEGLTGTLSGVQRSLGKTDAADRSFSQAKGLDIPLAVSRLHGWNPEAKPAADDLFSEVPDIHHIEWLRNILSIWERPTITRPRVEDAVIYADYASQYVLALDMRSTAERIEAARVLRNSINKLKSVSDPANLTDVHHTLIRELRVALERLSGRS